MKKYIAALFILTSCGGSSKDPQAANENQNDLVLTSSSPFEMEIVFTEDEGCGLLLNTSNPSFFGTARYYTKMIDENTLGEAVSIQFAFPSKELYLENIDVEDVDLSKWTEELIEGGNNQVFLEHTVTLDGVERDAIFQIMGNFGWWANSFSSGTGTGAVFNADYRLLIDVDGDVCAINGLGKMVLKK